MSSKAVEKDTTGTLTVAQVKKGGGIADPAAETQRVREAVAGLARTQGGVMWDAALLVHYVVGPDTKDDAGLIGEGRAYNDQTDYVVRGLGFAKSYGTTLKRLGRAATVHGVRRGSREWTFLASNAQRAEVGRAVALEDTGEFKAAVKELAERMATSGTLALPKGRGGQPDDGSGTAGNGGDDAENTAAAQSGQTEMTVGECLAALSDLVKGLSREDWAATEDRMTAIITRENTIRAKAGK